MTVSRAKCHVVVTLITWKEYVVIVLPGVAARAPQDDLLSFDGTTGCCSLLAVLLRGVAALRALG